MQSDIKVDDKPLETKANDPPSSKNKIWDRIWIVIAVLFSIFSALIWFFYGNKTVTSESPKGSSISGANEIPAAIPPTLIDKLNHTGLEPNPIAINPLGCSRPSNKTILQPPDNLAYVGFHLDWSKETPLNITRRLDFNSPAVM